MSPSESWDISGTRLPLYCLLYPLIQVLQHLIL